MNFPIKTVIVSFFIMVPALLNAELLTSYDFEEGNSNLAASALATSSDATAPWSGNFMGNVFSGAFRDTENDLIADNFGDALLTNRYVSFTITPNEAIDLQSFEVTLGATNAAGGTDYTVGLGVFSSLTGFAEGDELGTDSFFLAAGSGSVDKETPLTVSLSANSSLQDVVGPVEFRLYYIDDRAAAHSAFNVRVRDIGMTAIPEPATAVLAAGFVGLLVVCFRRRSG